AEVASEVLVLASLGADELERHRPLERRVLGEIDHAHPAAPEERLDAIARERCARGERCLHDALLRVRAERTIASSVPRIPQRGETGRTAERDGALRAVPRLEQTWRVFRQPPQWAGISVP